MGTLKDRIDAYNAAKQERVPADVLATMDQATEELKRSGIEDRALRTGDVMPDFELSNQHGERRRLSDYLAKSPVVLNVYRGGWCPYCNMEMKALHHRRSLQGWTHSEHRRQLGLFRYVRIRALATACPPARPAANRVV